MNSYPANTGALVIFLKPPAHAPHPWSPPDPDPPPATTKNPLIVYFLAPVPLPNPLEAEDPNVPSNGISLSSYYANCTCDANTVNAVSPVLTIVYE